LGWWHSFAALFSCTAFQLKEREITEAGHTGLKNIRGGKNESSSQELFRDRVVSSVNTDDYLTDT
jgi:hypothetical protein